jgi:hypothetical protein
MLITSYNLGNGERVCILLAVVTPDATSVIDDHLAYLVGDHLGQRKRFLLDILSDLIKDFFLERHTCERIPILRISRH